MKTLSQYEKIQNDFRIFWGNFPAPVMLVRQDKTIIAVNSAAEYYGCVIGKRCIDRGRKALHKDCLANEALAERRAKRSWSFDDKQGIIIDSYWIPLLGHDDLFIHFGVDITELAEKSLLNSSPCTISYDCSQCT